MGLYRFVIISFLLVVGIGVILHAGIVSCGGGALKGGPDEGSPEIKLGEDGTVTVVEDVVGQDSSDIKFEEKYIPGPANIVNAFVGGECFSDEVEDKQEKSCDPCTKYLQIDADLVFAISPKRLLNSQLLKMYLGNNLVVLVENIDAMLPYKLADVESICAAMKFRFGEIGTAEDECNLCRNGCIETSGEQYAEERYSTEVITQLCNGECSNKVRKNCGPGMAIASNDTCSLCEDGCTEYYRDNPLPDPPPADIADYCTEQCPAECNIGVPYSVEYSEGSSPEGALAVEQGAAKDVMATHTTGGLPIKFGQFAVVIDKQLPEGFDLPTHFGDRATVAPDIEGAYLVGGKDGLNIYIAVIGGKLAFGTDVFLKYAMNASATLENNCPQKSTFTALPLAGFRLAGKLDKPKGDSETELSEIMGKLNGMFVEDVETYKFAVALDFYEQVLVLVRAYATADDPTAEFLFRLRYADMNIDFISSIFNRANSIVDEADNQLKSRTVDTVE